MKKQLGSGSAVGFRVEFRFRQHVVDGESAS